MHDCNCCAANAQRFDAIERALLTIAQLLTTNQARMIKMTTSIQDVQDALTEETDVGKGVIALLTDVSARLAAAGTDSAKLADLKAKIDANKTMFAAAIVANTPADPNATPTV